ncbi:hypothetical protein IT087_03860 [Candidatus Uhrbacteria bacterium]|nr:hypothetical protein [Candidatus Uhrbacteria bacterium]
MTIAVLAFVCACGSPTNTGGTDAGPRMDTGVPVDAFVPPVDGFMPMPDSGPPGCTADAECNDGVDCTTDSCVTSSGNCRHVVTPALCDPGESCNPATGCEMGSACATSADCEDTDACTTMERCDPAARVCTFVPLDGDGDGDPPRVCGGGDCDDSLPGINSGAAEVCDNMDNNCDGDVDEGFDLMTDDANCGACGRTCRDGLSCSTGLCQCDDTSLTRCGSASAPYCVDTDTTPTDCGLCGNACPWVPIEPEIACSSGSPCPSGAGCDFGRCYSRTPCDAGTCVCPAGSSLCSGACLDTMTDVLNCGSCGNACPAGRTCNAGTCGCPGGGTVCPSSGGGTSCVNTASDEDNCGSCGNVCEFDIRGVTEVCLGGTCTACGEVGEACCEGDPLFSFDCLGEFTTCLSGACRLCGRAGQPCCERSVCERGVTCDSGNTCRATSVCGGVGEACCAGSACDAGGVCLSGTCRVARDCTSNECDLLAGGCAAGQACYVTNVGTGLGVECRTIGAGTGMDGSPCTNILDCRYGYDCNPFENHCREFCCDGDSSTCPAGQLCIPYVDGTGSMSGIGVCTPPSP